MRSFPIQFAQLNQARARRPRFVVAIRYETASVYFTSHDDIANVPGVVIQGCLRDPSAISQKLYPDEGRSTIGSFSFSMVDLEAAATEALRDHLANGAGPRSKEVRFFIGYEGMDFSAFERFTTQIIKDDSYDAGVYSFKCDDITREQNKEVFKPVTTTLRQSVTATATTIPVASTTRFQAVAHDTSYSDAPGQTVGYFKLEDEVIRFPVSGRTVDSFTGCTRGVLNTVAKPHAIRDDASSDRQPKIEEFIYLEGPGPKLALAVLTGDGLPSHWSLGFDPDYVRAAEFTNIGKDLWNASDPTKALVLRFEGLKAQDGKRFVEREILLLCGCYSPVYSDGTVGLRRMAAVVADAAPVAVLTENEIVEISALEHDGDAMHNQFRVRWAWDAVQEEFIRESRMVDGYSITAHGTAPLLTYEFRGLHGERHTDAVLAQRLDSIRDRYNEPPLRLSVTVFGSLNRLEIGDIVRIKVSEDVLRDYTTEPGDFNRSFEIQQMSYNASTGAVRLDLFGSTARPIAQPVTSSTSRPLPDAFYTAEGTALSSVVTISGNNVQPGTYTLTGANSLADEDSIFYHNGDLTILDGATINLVGNIHLKVKGFLTVNGDLNGTGGGKAGVPDPGGGGWDATFNGNPGFIGNSRGWDGVEFQLSIAGIAKLFTIPVNVTHAAHEANGASSAAWPVLDLRVNGNELLGLPTDLRGTGGPPGGRVSETRPDREVKRLGGTGGDGGAGLVITCRGFAYGSSGSIVLDGEGTTAGSAYTTIGGQIYPGAGGAGGPGAFLLLLDGNQIFFPTIAGKFFARAGVINQPGNYIPSTAGYGLSATGVPSPASGRADPTAVALSGFDYSTSAFRIQYLPESQSAEADPDFTPPSPFGLSVTGEAGFNAIRLTLGDFDQFDSVELWASIDNDRANAIKVGEGKKAEFKHELPILTTRYYWARTLAFVAGRKSYSEWFSYGENEGVSGTTLNPGGWTPVPRGDVIATVSTLEKSGGIEAWDSDAYSLESYEIGAFVSFRPAQDDKAFMIGLNVDPLTDAGFVSIDYAWYCRADGTAEIYEDGFLIASLGSYDSSTTFAVVYNSRNILYFMNGSVERAIDVSGVKLHLDSAFYSPGAKALDVKFGPSAPAGLDGADGADGIGVGLRLGATAQVFTFNGENVETPPAQTITFTATRVGIATATTWTTTPSVTLGGSGDIRTLTGADFGANTSVKVRAEADGYFDEITVVRLRNGTDAVVGFLTNEAHVLPATTTGVVSSYLGASGTFKVFLGTADVTGSTTFSVQSNPQSLTITGPSSSGAFAITAGFDEAEDTATVTFRAVYQGRTVDRIFSLSKSKTGAAGAAGAAGKDADFYDTFDHQDWAAKYNNRANGAVTITYPANGETGGRVLRAAGGQLWIASKENVPYDPAVIYKITSRIRRTAAGGGAPGTQLAYVGVEGVAADGTTLINTSGLDSSSSQHYNCFAGFDLSAVPINTWVERSAFFSGHATSGFAVSTNVNVPSKLYTGVRYFRPLLILNYNTGNGTEECDFIKVERLPTVGTAQIEPQATTELYSSVVIGPVTTTLAVGDITRIAIAALPFAHTAIVTATLDIWRGANPSNVFVLQTNTGGVGGTTSGARSFTATASPGERVTIQHQFSAAANFAYDYALRFFTSVPGISKTWENVYLQVELIKK